MLLFNSSERAFLQEHLHDDPHTLVLRHSSPDGIRVKAVADQLIARQKARTKLPGWYENAELVFPPALSVEQASSERTADYKASIISRNGGKSGLLLDLTGGMGVDSLAFSRQADRVIYIEQQPNLAELAAYNLPKLGGGNIEFPHEEGQNTTAAAFLTAFTETADWMYLDPARRDRQGGKVVRLEDCEPNILDWYRPADPTGFRHKTKAVLLKTSPLIDIELVIRQLPDVSAVHVVSVDNDCKEVLFVLAGRENPEIEVTAVNLRSSAPDEVFIYRRNDERTADVQFSDPLRYLYEPNASLLKAGAFRIVAERFGLFKLAPNSHLYTSDRLVADFPGRSFEILENCKPDRKAVHFFLPDGKANLSVRNFPESTETLRKKLSLTAGGAVYLFATTLSDRKKRILITRKPVYPSLH
ncbi:THUMP-like domain-containing protein [Larkinella humicola]|uniref:SAM-dependent methyltransferase n=1 Tax=Larkinella humicola TaxID=2607654 RepID=A0A5N1JSD9_9BACT|nr:RsmD family RNA methyltransferase [Larkinella humicola]KAA9357539.1 SAM-dependent methyltransferase [Larkinella humicola]